MHGTGGDAIEREADDDHCADIVLSGHQLLREADEAQPALRVDVGTTARVATQWRGRAVFRVEVAVGESVFERVFIAREGWIGARRRSDQ